MELLLAGEGTVASTDAITRPSVVVLFDHEEDCRGFRADLTKD
jgi:hypothetical protein